MTDHSHAPLLVWFRDDLRVADNPALTHAAQSGQPVVAAYVLDQAGEGVRPLGGASLWWLHGALRELEASLKALGLQLVLRRGPAADVVRDLVDEIGAGCVVWNRRYDPAAVAIDRELKSSLGSEGVEVRTFQSGLLFEPWTVKTKTGASPFKVYTPFWRAATSGDEPRKPLPVPERIKAGPRVEGDSLASWRLEPTKPDWAKDMARFWERGESAAHRALDRFLSDGIVGYGENRDIPDMEGTSRLSPHLRFGEISPFQVWHAVRGKESHSSSLAADARTFLGEIGWREFNHHILFHFEGLHERNFQPRFDAFPWKGGEKAFEAWTRGRTGYPIVDAGMRQLWQLGWMHNRVRMIVGSFLVKDLLLDWRRGEAWFWDTLVDADPANNPGNWQWVAGSGADAAPFFRVFNPVTQGRKFDPGGDYVRRFVPELAKLPPKHIHEPWKADADTLKKAGVVLGKNYPTPMVDHGQARDAALETFRNLREG